jgi:hypothetical protein
VRESDEELRREQEAAVERLGIDPAEFSAELGEAEAAPWRRGLFWWLRPRGKKEAATGPPDAPS